MRAVTIFTAAFAVATIAFWGVMLTNPPRSQAVEIGSLDPLAMMRSSDLSAAAAYDAI